jgi:putative ABC transport system permease protein
MILFLPMEYQIAAGRNFSREFSTDTSNFVINDATCKVLGWKTPDKAIGKNFMYGGVKGKVIGVIKDFHFESMHQRIVPIVMFLPKPEQNSYNNFR